MRRRAIMTAEWADVQYVEAGSFGGLRAARDRDIDYGNINLQRRPM